mgnify:CR=1 FL=1
MAREKDQSPGELGPPWTVLKLLRWTAGYFEEEEVTETPRLDADLLLAHVLGLQRVQLYARFDTPVSDEQRQEFRKLVKRRVSGEPVAYLVGRRAFWQMDLQTDARALIPRPETEVLVEVALERLSEPDGELRIADVGTGTGAVALAIATERDDASVLATDISDEALALAESNIDEQGFSERIECLESDLLADVPDRWIPFDMIVSNPPYVPESDRDDVMVDVREYEPDEALFAGPDGLATIERLVAESHDALREGAWLVVEIAHSQGEDVSSLFERTGFGNVDIRQDYAGNDRVVSGQK